MNYKRSVWIILYYRKEDGLITKRKRYYNKFNMLSIIMIYKFLNKIESLQNHVHLKEFMTGLSLEKFSFAWEIQVITIKQTPSTVCVCVCLWMGVLSSVIHLISVAWKTISINSDLNFSNAAPRNSENNTEDTDLEQIARLLQTAARTRDGRKQRTIFTATNSVQYQLSLEELFYVMGDIVVFLT